VFVGVIDPINPKVETSQEVRDRVLEASEFIPLIQLGTTDDCGFSPFGDAQAAGSLCHLDAGLELEPLFFTRINRTVRKDGTLRIDGILYEVDLSLRALEVQLRFDPYNMGRIEVYHRGKACGLARLADLHLNSQLDGSQHYDR
jgi:hypothetical protein